MDGDSHDRSVLETGGRFFSEGSAEIYGDRSILESEPRTTRNFRGLAHTVSLHQVRVTRNESSHFVGITAERDVGMKVPVSAKPLR